MINIENKTLQKIDISSELEEQKIVLDNIKEQKIVLANTESIDIQIANANPVQKISIGVSGYTEKDFELLVPRALSILPDAQFSQFGTSENRHKSRIYIEIDGKASHTTLEQLKQLNTKTILVDTLGDSKIKDLSSGDFALLKER